MLDLEVEDILFLIRNNKKFLNLFSDITELESDIISFMANRDCPCKERIIKYIEKHKTEIFKLTLNWRKIEKNWKKIIRERIEDEINIDSQMIETFKKRIKTKQKEEVIKLMSVNKTEKERKLSGHYIEMGAVAKNYKDMIDFGVDNKWKYNGICVIKSVDRDGKRPQLIYRNFFY